MRFNPWGRIIKGSALALFVALFAVLIFPISGARRISVSVSPSSSTLAAAQTQQFSASVTGTSNTAVTWSLDSQLGSISSTGLYTAPASITAAQSVTITATSAADPTKSDSASVTLQPRSSVSISLSITPTTALLIASETQQFSATVTGSSNTSVTWSASPVGRISKNGLYTAPNNVSALQLVTITATSAADSTKQATANVTLSPPMTISVSPGKSQVAPGQAQQFLATVTGTSNTAVTWTLNPSVGSLTSTGLYTAPASVTSTQSVTVTATSVVDPSMSGSATVDVSPAAGQTSGTFQLSEQFGVAWPEQPIEFRYDGGAPPAGTTRMLGPNGSEVPFQWVTSCSDATAINGCILVRSALPANANYTWTLQSGTPAPPPVTNPVSVAQVGSNYEIKNGLTGIRIVTPAANPSPWNLAPIQGILMPNGVWTGVGASANLLYSETQSLAGGVGASLQTPMYTATGYTVTVVDAGPLKVVLKASYTFNRPQYFIGNTVISPAGPGHHTFIMTMYANSKSIVIDEDSDMQFSYYLPLYAQLTPDIVRYRGHDSLDGTGVNNPACGYESSAPVSAATSASPIVITASSSLSNGQRVLIAGVQGNLAANGTYYAKTTGYPSGQFALYADASLTIPVASSGRYSGGGTAEGAYRGQGLTPTPDAYLPLTYNSDRPASYYCSSDGSSPAYHKLLTDYPAANHAAGWYMEIYRSSAGASAPAIGIYTGRASQQVGSATGPSMPGIYTSNNHWISSMQDAGIQVDNLLRGPDGSFAPVVHRNWGIWVSTQADLLAPAAHQPIADEQNSLTGINLSRLYTYQLSYPDPPNGWTWQYLSQTSANQLISWVRDGTSVCGSVTCYYNLLYNSDGSSYGRALLSMWQGNSSASVQTALDTGIALAQSIEQTLANGDNHFDGPLEYYQIGLRTSPQTAVLNAILMDSNATATQKSQAKAALALFGSLLWDNDWFPIDNASGESAGLGNQIQQYLQYRAQAAAAAPSQPYLGSKIPVALSYSTADLDRYFSSTGAAAGSTHYQSAFFQPLILNYLNFSQSGALSMSDPKWPAYANWELSIQTPPEPRFGNLRKGYSNGDGNTEADVRTGLLATALNASNPTLASNLMWAWQQSNSASRLTEDWQFATTVAAIDPTIPSIAPKLGSVNVPGYHSAERHGFLTPNETALWFIDGGFYSTGGHRHADDGQVSIYAHSAPLSIDWNANLYSPETPGRFMHNSVVLDSELSQLWNADNANLNDASVLLSNPTNTEFSSFPNSTNAVATFSWPDGTIWTRTVRTMAANLSYPIIYVTDTFNGTNGVANKTLTWNMMAAGAVNTPTGSITPTERLSSGCESPAGQLPSNGLVAGLSNGLQGFRFTGAQWNAHATGGINWDLWLIPSSSNAQYLIGNWGHGCHSGREMNEYQAANGANFAESQHILRVHDSGTFKTIIAPYRKTEAPARTVTTQACGTQIVQGAETTCFDDVHATYSNGAQSILTIYDNSAQAAFGITASGGPQEIASQSGTITWTINGVNSSTRSVTIPGTWYPHPAVPQSGNTFTYSYTGGTQAAPATIVFTTAP